MNSLVIIAVVILLHIHQTECIQIFLSIDVVRKALKGLLSVIIAIIKIKDFGVILIRL